MLNGIVFVFVANVDEAGTTTYICMLAYRCVCARFMWFEVSRIPTFIEIGSPSDLTSGIAVFAERCNVDRYESGTDKTKQSKIRRPPCK